MNANKKRIILTFIRSLCSFYDRYDLSYSVINCHCTR